MKRKGFIKTMFAIVGLTSVVLTGCVDQTGTGVRNTDAGNLKIAAASPAVTELMARLDIDLVGVPESGLSKIPSRYDGVTRIGLAMNPDAEVIKTLDPDYVVGPSALQSDLQPKLDAAGVSGVFINLESVEGLYKSVEELGELFGRQEEARKMTDEFSAFYYEYRKVNQFKESPRVLVLMGLPGSYVVATGKSYVGSLVRLAGGINVYENEEKNFITANTEDMQSKNPDIILRAAHAMPEDVMQMFQDEFETNDIWKHFRAVREKAVYDLPQDQFGMSAKFNFPKALETLQPMIYGEE
ncbi:heme ABC transporter substrate-binding protein IsdE [Lacrimispora sp. JR3]|uniref:heme ABC transporter substrate-binding protein IsdE n=1 Tax=Lacrimispora sinapis TaxID=3111456 RepID=UPI003747E29B